MSTRSYIAFIADATASRALAPPRRAQLQTDVRAALTELNRRFARALAPRFAVTLGDDLQCLLATAAPAARASRRGRGRDVSHLAGDRVTPLSVLPPLLHTLTATLWPDQVDGRRRARALLFGEALFVTGALVVGKLLEPLVHALPTGLWWGRVALLATGYLYVSGRGMVLVRSVLELPSLQMRRDADL